ncbi:3'(2'),5'-bisphosphate nucleotidase CysQ [Brevundimonas sp.]|uniref:3'(2'),5'-bisphosphate nucleotidase CysQ n=1 Tax=Brevundimonas sp. TaxID=1871086 RepID=UPI002ABBC01B|nr:3'(2'),5'-bisphosphate nucleotidase CysQ [Brevundimonas sp.]MDZ4364994.1 3'(2'),5'-bisphosphate nucleotidase CysQ [Brevundimonas sp.]
MLDRLVAIASKAGAVILDIYGRADVGATDKGDGSPVTLADEAAEAVILAALARDFPDIPVVAEEAVAAGQCPDVGDRFFLVDPLDGTKEFISRNGEFTVNIALVEDGLPVVGVVYAPALGLMYAGDADGARISRSDDGVFRDWTPLVAGPAPIAGLKVVASRSHMGSETSDYLAGFEVADLVSAGSSLKLCKVAGGEADLYPRLGRTMAWDIAAGDAVLRAAGGMVRCMQGRPFSYHLSRVPGDTAFANPWFVASGAFDPADLKKPTA